jgi:hypothetical protein
MVFAPTGVVPLGFNPAVTGLPGGAINGLPGCPVTGFAGLVTSGLTVEPDVLPAFAPLGAPRATGTAAGAGELPVTAAKITASG